MSWGRSEADSEWPLSPQRTTVCQEAVWSFEGT
jgi:hypothetical protein